MISQAPDHPESVAPEQEEGRKDQAPAPVMPPEIGGRGGLDPVRYGDWEKNGRCIDF